MPNIIKKNKKSILLAGSLLLGGVISLIFILSLSSKKEVTPLESEEEIGVDFSVFEKEEFQELEVFEHESEAPEEKGRENPFEEYEIVEEDEEQPEEEDKEIEELPEEDEEIEELPEEEILE